MVDCQHYEVSYRCVPKVFWCCFLNVYTTRLKWPESAILLACFYLHSLGILNVVVSFYFIVGSSEVLDIFQSFAGA